MKIETLQDGRLCKVMVNGVEVHKTGRIAAKGYAFGLWQKNGGQLWNQKKTGKMVLVREGKATHP